MPAATTRFRMLMTVVATLGAIACGEDDAPSTGGGGASASGGASGSGAASASGGRANPSGGASTTGGAPSTGGAAVDYCSQASDCGWGEIDHEILAPADCICLLGCPYLPLNRETIARRQDQYDELCDPMVDGSGNPCPVDECVMPPEPTCEDNACGPLDPWG